MSSWVDDEYAIKYFSTQRNFKQVASGPLKLRCSCPVCGDSRKDTLMARFWYYYHQGTPFVHCYNCDYSAGFGHFLKTQDEGEFNKYQMAKFKDNVTASPRTVASKPVEASEKLKSTMPIIKKLEYSACLADLPETHPIIGYVKARKIPEDKWDRLYFTSNWQELVNTVKPGTFENPTTEHRLVIPIFNADGKIEAFQGRALKQSKVKYMTIKADESSTKVYGQDTIDDSKYWVFMLEGPLDSLFLENACAITGGKIGLESVPYPRKRIWVLDNEPRHPDTIKRMESLIAAGEAVCFWDMAPWKSKDINDMVAKEGADPAKIQEYILGNFAKGMLANVRMMKYRKI